MSLAGRPHRNPFRFIVVGGGSAGCLLARRLAEQQTEPVALVEGGPATDDVRTVVPNFYPRAFGSALDWGWQTTPQAALGGRRIAWPRGRLLGGSGAINALIYMQAAHADLLRWGWTWATDQTEDVLLQAGGLPHSVLGQPHPWTQAFLSAAEQAGVQPQASLARSRPNACGLFSLAQQSGRRRHTGQRLDGLERLTVLAGHTALRLRLAGELVQGIEVAGPDGQQQLLQASEQLILCAGALGTPALLMRSGIGPRDALQAAGVVCRHELPAVGQHLQDHLVCPLVFRTHGNNGLPRRHDRRWRHLYRESGSGPLASNIAEAGALLADSDQPGSQFQIHFTPTHYLKYPKLATSGQHCSLAVSDLHPASRGEVRLVPGASPLSQLHIDPQYLTHSGDLERMLAAIRWARRLAAQPGLAAILAAEELPGAKRQDDAALAKYLRAFAQSIYHPVGSCRMESPLARGPLQTVVDQQLRPHGLQGLRIADASVLPDLPSGNPNAAVLLIAERAASLLLQKSALGTAS